MEASLSGKTAVVTGGTAGIGRETVRALVRQGARVLFTGRNPEAGGALVAEVRAALPGAVIEFLPVDFASLASVKKLAGEIIVKAFL